MIERPASRWSSTCAGLLVLIAPVSLAAQQAKVKAGVSIEAPTFRANIGNIIEVIEKTLSEELVDGASFYFPFLKWESNASDTTAPSLPTLQVVLEEKTDSFVPEFVVTYRVTFTGQSAQTLRSLEKELYGRTDDPPTHSPQRLERDLRNAIRGELDKDAFRLQLQENFLQHIPLTTAVIVKENEKRLVLPLLHDSIRTGDESQFRVKFLVPFPEQADGIVRMSPDGKMYGPEVEGFVRCLVKVFNLPPDVVQGWHPKIPDVLEDAENIAVYMEFYQRDTSPGARAEEEGFVVLEPR